MHRLLRLVFLILLGGIARAEDVTFTIDAIHDQNPIPPGVYGTNDLAILGSTLHRHGGNRHTGLNWENNASNAGTDYLNSSDSYLGTNAGIGNSQVPGALLRAWVDGDRAQGLSTIITLPIAGYVAADMNGPVSAAETAPSARWKQIIFNKNGPLVLAPDPNDGVVYLDEMVNFLLANYGQAATGGVTGYSLDNEPALWPSTHPRIHPNATTYQEMASRDAAAASMATALDPTAEIYAPVEYGWNEHLNLQNAPDSSAFNGTYGTFTNYFLAQMKAASDSANRRLLHRFDMHWYPEARGDHRIVFETTSPSYGTNNDIDARLQAPRSLWDPAYVENSWITQYTTNGGGIQLLPRLRSAVNQYFPGTGLAITEYNYGGTEHISGGVAQADVLGIFGEFQTVACFWPLTSDNSYVTAAFKLFRNYNSNGSAFGSTSLTASASDNAMAAIHAARVIDGKLTVVAINRSRTLSHTSGFQFSFVSGQSITDLTAYRLSASGGSQVQQVANPPAFSSTSFSDTLPAMSATLYEIQTIPGGFAWWQQSKFGANASNPAIAGADADPDRDGVANLLEYVTNQDPNLPNAITPLRVQILPAAGGNPAQFQLQFDRRKGFVDTQVYLQSGDALGNGQWTTSDLASLNPTITQLNDQTERWTIKVPLSMATSFYRLTAQH